MGLWLRILAIAFALYLVYRLIARTGLVRPAASRFPCSTCAHCGKLFDDGVLCRFGSKEVFKNETHIANCVDWRRRSTG